VALLEVGRVLIRVTGHTRAKLSAAAHAGRANGWRRGRLRAYSVTVTAFQKAISSLICAAAEDGLS